MSVKQLFLASTAAAILATTQAPAQSAVEPDGMPVYREQKSSFFRNPFSYTYQRLWNKAKSEPNSPVYEESIPEHTTNAGYASVETYQPAAPDSGRPWHTVRKPKSKIAGTLRRGNTTAPSAAPTKSPRVIHVNDVNEGTPPVGVMRDATADPEILNSLAPGEQVLKVTERVIGVYRDGKLVVISPEEQHRFQAVGKTPAREIDPWFGDEVGVPSNEIAPMESGSEEMEALPPQSMEEMSPELLLPDLPPSSDVLAIERTSYIATGAETLPETLSEAPAVEVIVAPVETPARVVRIPREVLDRYRSNYRQR